MRTLFEVEGHYVEIPNAYTYFKVPTKFLIIFGAVLIGIATGKANQLDPIIGGAFGGVGGLLINILATRYMKPSTNTVEITWTEELFLTILKNDGEKSIIDLRKQTRLYKQTVKEILESLERKGLVEKRKEITVGKKTKTTYIYTAKE